MLEKDIQTYKRSYLLLFQYKRIKVGTEIEPSYVINKVLTIIGQSHPQKNNS